MKALQTEKLFLKVFRLLTSNFKRTTTAAATIWLIRKVAVGRKWKKLKAADESAFLRNSLQYLSFCHWKTEIWRNKFKFLDFLFTSSSESSRKIKLFFGFEINWKEISANTETATLSTAQCWWISSQKYPGSIHWMRSTFIERKLFRKEALWPLLFQKWIVESEFLKYFVTELFSRILFEKRSFYLCCFKSELSKVNFWNILLRNGFLSFSLKRGPLLHFSTVNNLVAG